MWGEVIERMPADGRKHPDCGKTKEMEITARDEAIDFYENKLEQLTAENDLLDKKMSKLSDEKIKLERGIINLIKLLGD